VTILPLLEINLCRQREFFKLWLTGFSADGRFLGSPVIDRLIASAKKIAGESKRGMHHHEVMLHNGKLRFDRCFNA
jgi:hypothetical protein